jgi:hypothetical protein
MTALPDVDGWDYLGAVGSGPRGSPAVAWQYLMRHEGKLVNYTFFMDDAGAPVQLYMKGQDIFSGSHYDEWVVDYHSLDVGDPDPAVFEVPSNCSASGGGGGGPDGRISLPGPSAAGLRMASLVPSVRYGGDAIYDAFIAVHGTGRHHATLGEYKMRASTLRANLEVIEAHNMSPNNRTYTMAINQFGDWNREEFLKLMLPKRARMETETLEGAKLRRKEHYEKKGKLIRNQVPYEALTDPDKVPRSVDWRGVGPSIVKDQASCGSCWSFGAVGAMESAWYRATGHMESLSEQQVMDCSWGWNGVDTFSAAACDGGEVWVG